LFPLPWIEVRCNGPAGGGRPVVVAEQSGLQAALGTLSDQLPLVPPGSAKGLDELRAKNLRGDSEVPWSGAAALYVVLVAGGVLGGLLLRHNGLRRAVLAGCAIGAALVLLGRVRDGFPLEQKLAQALPREVRVGDLFAFGTSGAPLEVHYTPWFWLSLASVLAAVVAVALETGSPTRRVRSG
jgi:hypothetical protein